MTLFEILIFGLALLLGQLAGAWVQALAAIRSEAKRLHLIACEQRQHETWRSLGVPFYLKHERLGHVAVFPMENGELWHICDTLDQAIEVLAPTWRDFECA